MGASIDEPRGARKAQTSLPEADASEEILDFAQFIREIETHHVQSASRAALVDPNGNARRIQDEIFRSLDQMTNALAEGDGITVVPQGMSTTTQQAADFLRVSRPTLGSSP